MKRRRAVKEAPAKALPAPQPVVPLGAPYDPVAVPIRKLADALAELGDPAAIRAMQSVDPRASSARYYEARLAELADA